MGVPLSRAWEICRLLDEEDALTCARSIDRAIALTQPTTGTGKTGRAGLPRGSTNASIDSPLDPVASERVRKVSRRRLGLSG